MSRNEPETPFSIYCYKAFLSLNWLTDKFFVLYWRLYVKFSFILSLLNTGQETRRTVSQKTEKETSHLCTPPSVSASPVPSYRYS